MDRRSYAVKYLIFVCFLLSAGVHLLAYQEPRDSEELEEIDDYLRVVEEGKEAVPKTNTTATRLPVPMRATPASVGIVPLALNEAQNNLVLGDALRNVSGINVMTNFGVHDFFTMRGLDSLTGGLVLTDSAPEPEATFYNLYNIERVEVLKGPGAYAYGGNPLSGTVNLIRKQPVFEDFTRFSFAYGRYDSVRGTLDTGVANPELGLAFRLNAMWQESDGYRDDKANEATGINPALSWRFSENSFLSVNLELAQNEYEPDSGIPFLGNGLAPVPRTTSYQSPADFSEQDLLRVRIDYVHHLNDRLTLRNRFYHTDLDWTSHGTIFLGIQPVETRLDLLRGQTQLSDRQKFTGNQFEAMLALRSGSVEHHLMLGLEVVRNDDLFGLSQLALLPIDVFQPVEFAPGPLDFPLAPRLDVDSRSLNVAFYALDRIRFSEEFQLYVGGRFDRIDYEADTFTDGFPIANERDSDEFSPMLGLVYTPSSNLTLYANAGESFAPPSTLTLGDAEPEHSSQVELGSKHQFWGGRLALNLAAYQLEREDIGIPDETGITRQTGDQRSRGLEVEFAANLGHDWRAYAAYAYTDSELTEFREFDFFTGGIVSRAGNVVAFAPEHIFNTWISKEFANGIGFGAGGRYVDDQFIAEANVLRIDSYVLFDASLFYNASNWQVAVNLKNIGDEEYETRGLKTPFVGSVIPGNPFEATGTLRLKF